MTTAPVAAARVRGSAPLYVPAPRRVETVAATGSARPEAAAAPGSSSEPYDVQAEVTAPPVAARETTPAAAVEEPGTWSPVPVPTPTYMLKARAHRAPAPAGQPVSELPFDGNAMALEEEFEELPAVNLG